MNTKRSLLALLFLSTVCFAQVPVALDAAAAQDEIGQRFLTSLQSEIRLSGKFSLWPGPANVHMPAKAIRIVLVSVEMRLTDGKLLGAAVVAIASHFSQKDQGAERLISINKWGIVREQAMGDITREYLATLVGQ